MIKSKIVDISKIDVISKKLKKEGKKIVQCHGVFDLIHPGHIKHFEAAKKFGDILIVSITEDKYVNKGPSRPIFNEKLRSETIAALQMVDFVTISRMPTAIFAIEKIKPDYYVKGQDYKNIKDDFTSGILEEKNKVEEFGGQLVFTEEVRFSSSRLINQHLNAYEDKVVEYFNDIRQTITFNKIHKIFEDISKYKILVIGDIILDNYQFVKPLGKASKSATITSKKLNSELYAGGALAVANHIADFVKDVTLISYYGLNDGISYYNFIKKHLHPNVDWEAIHIPERPTILKRRFIDYVFKNKLFEIIEIEDSPLLPENNIEIFEKLKKIDDYDIIVIADFGHGLIDKEIICEIYNKNTFIAVNTQTNSANIGFNLLTKYPKCDYFSIDKEEAQLAIHDKYCDVENSLNQLLNQLNVKKGTITLGVDGSIVGDTSENKFTYTPAFSIEVIDTIGAGDAFLSITSLLAKQGASTAEIGFIGNAVGAMAVKILGNKSYIEKIPLLKYLKTILA